MVVPPPFLSSPPSVVSFFVSPAPLPAKAFDCKGGTAPLPSSSSPPSVISASVSPGGSSKFSPGNLPVESFVFKGGTRTSFRDLVLGGRNKPATALLPDLLAANLASVTLLGGDRLKPAICFADNVKKTLRAPWEDGLFLQVLGLRVLAGGDAQMSVV